MHTADAPSIANPGPIVCDLRAAVVDCTRVLPWLGLLRVILLGICAWGGVAIAWTQPLGLGFVAMTAIAAVFCTFWLTCTHEAAHHTLTGWKWLDETIARLISWPLLWPVGTYAELHRLHHSWNGRNFDDPERTQWTQAEYDTANGLTRWYVRHQWSTDVFGFGAIGLIAKMFRNGWHQGYRAETPRPKLRWQLAIDLVGILTAQTIGLYWAISCGVIIQYACFWIVLERIIGALMQAREHIEHYGLWRSGRAPVLTQLYATRNLTTTPFVNWLMSGLPYHGVHHAFPEIPSDRLPLAFARIETVLRDRDLPPLPCDSGYWRTSLHLARSFETIATADDSVD